MKTLGNIGKKVLVYTLVGITALTTAVSAIGCRKEVNINEEVNSTTPVTETYVETVAETVPERSNLELKLEGIADIELKNKIENELNYFTNDEQKINYIDEVIALNEQGTNIEYLFDNNYLNANYNPNEKILWAKSFDNLNFDAFVASMLLYYLSEAKNPKDADEDGFDNLSEVSGNYLISTGPGEKSNPLDPKDTPEHMAKFDMVLINPITNAQGFGELAFFAGSTQKDYVSLVNSNPRLDDLLVISSEDLDKLDYHAPDKNILTKDYNGTYINTKSISIQTILEKIDLFSKSDYIFLSWYGGGPHNSDNFSYFFNTTLPEYTLFNFLESIYGKYGEGTIFQFSQCGSGNLNTLPNTGAYVLFSTDDAIPHFTYPQSYFIETLVKQPFNNIDNIHNNSVKHADYGRFYSTDLYHSIDGLQFTAKKTIDGNILYWDRGGVFDYGIKNGKYVRENNGQIVRNNELGVAIPHIANFFEDYRFK